MSFPRLGAIFVIVAVALAGAPASPLAAGGQAVEPAIEPTTIAMAAATGGSVPPHPATEPARPSCMISEGQVGQLDLAIPVAASAGAGSSAGLGRCSTRIRESVPTRARYRAVPFAPDTIGRPGNACPTFSPDGATAVYVKPGVGLVEARRLRGGWTEAEPLPFSGGGSTDSDPFLSPDGRRLFFWSTRPTGNVGTAAGSSEVWVAERRADGWGAPQRLEPPVNDGSSEPIPAVAADGTLYFASFRPGGRGAVDLYRARPSATGYATPENLGVTVNSPAAELDGYISPEQDVLVFASDRPGGFGRLDLYVSHRVVGGWSPARNLGRAVNGPDDEHCPQITPDGRFLVFSTPEGIFQVDAAVLDDATP